MTTHYAWACIFAAFLPSVAKAETPPLWGKLPPGPHAIGFKSSWHLDYSRQYNTTFDDGTAYAAGKAPRPILLNQWYPAESSADAKRMPHRDYLNIRSDDPHLAKYALKLSEYVHGIIAKE